jgi:phytanoyl-CoA hydroxylase
MSQEVEPTTIAGKASVFLPDELQQFERDGFVIVKDLADESMRSRMLSVTHEGLERKIGPIEYEAEVEYPGAPASHLHLGGATIRRLKQALSRDYCFTEWVSSPSLNGRLQQLLGPDRVLPLAHHNCIMTKHPRFSSDTNWHQDIRYWSYQRSELISIWLALGTEHAENGCLQLIPGTHRIDFDRRRFDDNLFLRPDLVENQEIIQQAVHATLEPGDVIFFHCRLFHAASRNHGDTTKYSVVFTFRSADNLPTPNSRSASLPELVFP